MARRMTTPRGKRQQDKPQYECRHCKHSYDWCSKALDGHFILCRCPFYKEGKYCRFLSDPQCEHFLKREDADNGNE